MTEENERTAGLSKTIYDLNTKYWIKKKRQSRALAAYNVTCKNRAVKKIRKVLHSADRMRTNTPPEYHMASWRGA